MLAEAGSYMLLGNKLNDTISQHGVGYLDIMLNKVLSHTWMPTKCQYDISLFLYE